ncbi:MAG: polyprenyl synthetase family protein [Phycisphaeraceae bacterium]
MLLLTPNDTTLGPALSAMLEEVQQRFSAELLSDTACVNELVEHVERYRGKMLRPTLVLVSAMATHRSEDLGELREPALIAAAVCEMVHMATLVHDDVLDDAHVRRRGATINRLRGNEAAVMLGDYLISHAYHLCSSLGRADISRAVAHATNTVCEGELLQLSNRHNLELDERVYFEIIRRKTAALCGLCCEMPIRLRHPGAERNGDQRLADALFAYGEKLGIAFQIVDDILDLSGDEQTVGKSVARDLAKGKLTLPLIRHLQTADPIERRGVADLIAQAAEPGLGDDEAGELARAVAQRVTDSGAMEYARDWARRLVEQAVEEIKTSFGPSSARDLMEAMAGAVIDRRF